MTVKLARGSEFNSWIWQSTSRDFFLADHTLPTHPEWQKMVQSPFNGTKQPVGIDEESNHG